MKLMPVLRFRPKVSGPNLQRGARLAIRAAAGPMGSGRCSLPKDLRSEGVEDRVLQTLNWC